MQFLISNIKTGDVHGVVFQHFNFLAKKQQYFQIWI
jgi:hypothetical protein